MAINSVQRHNIIEAVKFCNSVRFLQMADYEKNASGKWGLWDIFAIIAIIALVLLVILMLITVV